MDQRASPAPVRSLSAEAFIRSESTLSVVSERPFEQVATRLEGSIAVNDLSIVQLHDFNRLLAAHDIALRARARVYEVWDPQLAAQLIKVDAGLAHLLPWRISMHDEDGVTTVTTPMPTTMIPEFSYSMAVARVARSFEARLQRVLTGSR